MDGVIVVDKPSGWTSHDVVNRMRRIAGTRRVGHLGTLDPSATGVLPVVIGRATRLAQFYTRNSKVYQGVIRFGYATDTYDGEGVASSPAIDITLDRDRLREVLDRFVGRFEQVPPAVSAKKIGGRPAYELARKQQVVELKPVEIEVYSIDLLDMEGTDAGVRVHCSAGTYIRSIAHDAGQAMGCGAFLSALRRTASGDFKIEDARTLEQLAELSSTGHLSEALIPASRMLPHFPAETVDLITEGQIRNGRDFRVSPFRADEGARYVKAITEAGDLVAIAEVRMPNVYHPLLVF